MPVIIRSRFEALARLRDDASGATLVQFVAVLPCTAAGSPMIFTSLLS